MTSLLGALATAARPATTQPRNASPVPLTTSFAGGFGRMMGSAGTESQLRAMGGVGTLYSVVNKITTATAAVDWHLYREAKSGLEEDREEVTSHACIDLVQRPNPHQTRSELMEASGQHFELTGEAPIVISRHERFRALPLELWSVRPDRIEPVPHPYEFISKYLYRTPDGQQLELELDEVLRLMTPCPWDPYRGLGVVQTILVELDSARASAEWNRNFFINSAEPGGVIEYSEVLEDPDFERARKHWADQHKGVRNAHRVAIIEGGKWVDRKYTRRDMQFVELRAASRDTILEGWGLHKASLGITDDVNRAASLSAKALFAEDILVPRLKRWRGLFNRLLAMYGDTARGLTWDYENPIPPDAEAVDRERDSKTKAWASLCAAGADPDEAADAVGLPRGLVKITGPEATPTEGDGPAARQLSLVEQVQKVYLGVGTVLTWQEARQILNDGGANLDLTLPPPAAAAPPLAAPAARMPRAWPRAAADPPDDPDAVDEIDLSPVQAAWEAAVAALLASFVGGALVDWIDALVDQVRDWVRSGGRLADLQVDPDDAVDLVTDALADLADIAAGHVVAEAADQDVDLDPATPTRAVLKEQALTTVELLGQVYELSAAREAQRVAGPDPDADELADLVRTHLEALTTAQPEQQLGAALTSAQNQARAATLTTGPVGAIYASEQMDLRTCGPCREIHGRWITNTDDLGPLWRLYPGAGYVDCKGRSYCRGTFVGVWREGKDAA